MRFSIRIYATEIHDIDLKLKNGNKNKPISSVSLYANQMCLSFNIEYIRMTRFISSSTITIRCCVCISLFHMYVELCGILKAQSFLLPKVCQYNHIATYKNFVAFKINKCVFVLGQLIF